MWNCVRRVHFSAGWRSTALTAIVFVAAGCGPPSDQPSLGLVEGTISLDGQPLPDAQVVFQPDEGRPSYGKTDAEGRYQLEYLPNTPGAKVGPHTVSVSTWGIEEEGDEEREIPEKVPAKYNVNTELTAEVSAGENTFDFDLDSEGEIITPPEAEAAEAEEDDDE